MPERNMRASSAPRGRSVGRALAAFAVFGGVACVPAAACAADPQAGALVKLFIDACIPHMGDPQGVRAWAAAKGLGQITEPGPLNVFVGDGGKGAAWAAPLPVGNFAVSIRGFTQACAVWAQAAAPTDVESAFKKLIDGVGRPGLKIRVDKDVTTETAAGRTRELVYNIVAPGSPTSYEFTMLTAEHVNPAFQASLQVAHAKAD